MVSHLCHGASGAIRWFAGWIARGSVGQPTIMRERTSRTNAVYTQPAMVRASHAPIGAHRQPRSALLSSMTVG